jgi:hypothetical protein
MCCDCSQLHLHCRRCGVSEMEYVEHGCPCREVQRKMRELRDIIADNLPDWHRLWLRSYGGKGPDWYDQLAAADDLIWAMQQAGYQWSMSDGTGDHAGRGRQQRAADQLV